jgi:hypothetical protein
MIRGRLQGAFSMCVSLSDKPFDAEACDIGGHASATNGLSDMKSPSKTPRVIDPLCIYNILIVAYLRCKTLKKIGIEQNHAKNNKSRTYLGALVPELNIL